MTRDWIYVCDRCGEETRYADHEDAEEDGWEQWSQSFETTRHDMCPGCAEALLSFMCGEPDGT